MSLAIVLTGASSGFGWNTARILAERGHHVVASMRGVEGKNREKAQELRDFASQGGHRLDVVEIDVVDDRSVAAGVAAAIEVAGRIDVLINNAGVGTWGPQEGFSSEQVLRMLDINVVGPLRMNQAVAPHMRKAGGGYIMYISSGLGRIQLPFIGPYTASKHAVEAIAGVGDMEMRATGIETTVVQPGAYGTSFLHNSIQPAHPGVIDDQPTVKAMYEAFAGGFEERVKAGQIGDPTEVTDAIVELVEMDKGTRPLRRCVGADVQQAVNAINDVAAQVQKMLAEHMGFGG